MEDLLKFVPLALYVAYKLFGRSKKNEQKRISNPKSDKKNSTEQSPPSIKDILQELGGDKTTASAKRELTYEELHEERKRERTSTTQQQYEVQPKQEKNPDFSRTPNTAKEKKPRIETLKVKLEEESHGNFHFKLRDAIIAQTILKRPEY